MMIPRLIACDLDGTLLTTDKKLSPANAGALIDMAEHGVKIVLASGRLGSSMSIYSSQLPFPCAMLTLNGAVVYTGAAGDSPVVYSSHLAAQYAEYLLRYAEEAGNDDFIFNYYIDDKLYTTPCNANNRWCRFYYEQTMTQYQYADPGHFSGRSPSKILFVGDPVTLDRMEVSFKALWGSQVYIVRTWEYYLEFLNVKAHKGAGIKALLDVFNIRCEESLAFGDGENDVPMFEACGYGIALKNTSKKLSAVAQYISPWSNDEDAVAHEWERIKKH